MSARSVTNPSRVMSFILYRFPATTPSALLVKQLSRALSKPSEDHRALVKHLFSFLAGSLNFYYTYERRGFKVEAYPDVTWVNKPENGKSTYSHIAMLVNDPFSLIYIVGGYQF